MFFTGLKLCHNCGVYEVSGIRKRKNKKFYKQFDLHFWSNLPKYGLQKELCPKCNPDPICDRLVEHYG